MIGRGAGMICVWLALLATVDVSAEDLIRLTRDGHLKQRPAWSPDGSRLVFARHEGSTIFLYLLDVQSGEERRLTERTDPEYDAVFCPVDGNRLLMAVDRVSPNQGDIEIFQLSLESGELQAVVASEGGVTHEEWPAWSPDGKRIAFTSTRDGNQELYAADAEGQEMRRLTSDPAIDAHPCWSPDGESIAFATDRWGDLEIAVIRADGTGLQRITDSRGLDDYPAFSPDGKLLAFATNRGGHLDIAVYDLSAGNVTLVNDDAAIDSFPAWHPAGLLTFVSNRDDGFDVYQMAARPRP